jgi:chromosome segregation ATPase
MIPSVSRDEAGGPSPSSSVSQSKELEQLRERLVALTCDSERYHALRATLDAERAKLRTSEMTVATLTQRLAARDRELDSLKREATEQRHLARELGLCRGKLVNAERRLQELQAKLGVAASAGCAAVASSFREVSSGAAVTRSINNVGVAGAMEDASSVSSVDGCLERSRGTASSADSSRENHSFLLAMHRIPKE